MKSLLKVSLSPTTPLPLDHQSRGGRAHGGNGGDGSLKITPGITLQTHERLSEESEMTLSQSVEKSGANLGDKICQRKMLLKLQERKRPARNSNCEI